MLRYGVLSRPAPSELPPPEPRTDEDSRSFQQRELLAAHYARIAGYDADEVMPDGSPRWEYV
jgi:hypothetical protein